MIRSSGWKPGTIDLAIPGAPLESELVIPSNADYLEVVIVAPGGTVSVTPPLLILGWQEDLAVYRELAQITNTDPSTGAQVPFDVGPVNAPPSYKLTAAVGVRRLHIQASALSGALTTNQRGTYEDQDT